MPWFPDFVSAAELARRQTRAAGQADPVGWRPQQDSNLRTRLRRPLLYPLSYGGSDTSPLALRGGPEPGYQGANICGHGVDHYASAGRRR
jgi:hypothetical protein